MIVYGYAKNVRYTGDGTMQIQLRIPNVHGAYQMSDYKGKRARNYVADQDLPWYPALVMPQTPGDGDVVALSSLDTTSSNWLVIGITGGSYNAGATNI